MDTTQIYNLVRRVRKKNNEKNKTRKRNITWFNPRSNINVATNVAKTVLTLIDKHFPKNKKVKQNLQKNHNKSQLQLSTQCQTDNLKKQPSLTANAQNERINSR